MLIVTQLIKKPPASLWKSKVKYCLYRSPPLDPILSHLNPVHTFTFYFFKIHFKIIFPSMPRSSLLVN